MTTNGIRTRRVLVAEDAENVLYGPILRAEGYQTEEVTTGDQAIRKIREGRVDLAVLHEELPDRTGLEILRELGKPTRIPIIVCSSAFNVLRAVEAMKAGAWDYLPRAFPRNDLVRAAAAALQGAPPPVPEKIADRKRQAQKMELFGRLASGVIHDFNNLLTVILGYCELLKPDLSDRASRAYLNEIEQVVQNGSGLTQQLLAFARNRPIDPRPLDLNFVLLKLEAMLGRLLGESIRIDLRLAPVLGMIRADSNQMEQVILNLAVNARDAMPRGGQLLLETANIEVDPGTAALPAGAYVILRVIDTGVGMDEATQKRLFEPFFTTKAEGQGTGLGLTTVFSIVEHASGRIDVASQPGQGTTFTLTFPRLMEPPAQVPVVVEPMHRAPATELSERHDCNLPWPKDETRLESYRHAD